MPWDDYRTPPPRRKADPDDAPYTWEERQADTEPYGTTPAGGKTPGPCPEGYEWEDGGPDFPMGRCKIKGRTWEDSQGDVAPGWPRANQGQSAGGGSGGGAGGSVPLPAQERYKPAPQDLELDDTIMGGIRDALSGKLAPYDAATIARMRAASFQAAQGQGDQQRAALSRDLTRRGLTRSGIAVEGGQAIDRNIGADVSRGMRDVLVKAATANYQAKEDALKRAESYLNQRQQFALANIRTTQDYQIASAQNSLAYARLRQEWDSLQAQFKQQLKLAEMGNDQQLTLLLAELGYPTGRN